MKVAANPQHGVVDHLVAIRMHGHRFRNDLLDLAGHHAKLPTMALRITLLRLVGEQGETNSEQTDTSLMLGWFF